MAKNEIQSSENREAEGRKSRAVRALSPFDEMERMFGSIFPRGRMRPFDMEWPSWTEMSALAESKMPRMDIIERDNEVVVRAELAGVDKKDIDVSVTDNTVTVKGSTKEEHKEEDGDFFRSEIKQGGFSRTAALPCDVDGDKAKARFTDGMLELTIPKLEGSRRRSIKVD